MYLVISSSKSLVILQDRIIKDFHLTHNDIFNPQIYNLKLNYANIEQLDILFNSYQAILLSSLNTIDIVKKQIIKNSNNIEYFVMGRSSYIELQQYTKNKIYYPINQTGYLALINEIFASELYTAKNNTSNLLILSSNNNLQDKMLNLFANYFYDIKFLTLYNIEYCFDMIDSYINQITHIVINSSSVIKPLIHYFKVKNYNYSNRLKFITYHLKIKQILESDYKVDHVIFLTK